MTDWKHIKLLQSCSACRKNKRICDVYITQRPASEWLYRRPIPLR